MKRIYCFLILIASAGTTFGQSGYVHDAMEKKYGEPGAEKLNEWMNGKLLNVKVESQYTFPVSMEMQCTSYKKGAVKDEYDISYLLNADKQQVATKGAEGKKKSETLMIYDYKANAMIMLNEKDHTGMAFNINAFMSGDAIKRREEAKADGQGSANTSCKKTGKTKTILGYSCEQYVCVDQERDTKTEIWITDKIHMDLSRTGGRGPMGMYLASAQGLGGMLMELTSYKGDQMEMKMEVTKLNEHADFVVKTSDYKMNSH